MVFNIFIQVQLIFLMILFILLFHYHYRYQVFFHNGMSDKSEDYELCMRAESVHLPKEGFFGVTAATGGLAGMILISILNFNFQLCRFFNIAINYSLFM